MMKEGLSYFTDTQLSVVAMIIFMVIFTGVLFWVFRKSGRAYYSNMEMMPLSEPQALNKGAANE